MRYRCIYLLRTKDEAFDAYLSYEAFAQNQIGSRVRRFRDNKGGEYIGWKWDEHFKHWGIIHEHTTKATPQQNGISEHTNHTLIEGMVVLLQQACLPVMMWGDALKLLVCIINVTPTATLPHMTPYEAWHGHKPDLGMLCTFGCTTYVHVQKEDWDGLQPRTRRCIYLSFETGYKGWHCYYPITKCTIISCNVIFNESKFPGLSTSSPTNHESLLPAPTLTPREAAIPPDIVQDLQDPNPAPDPSNEDLKDQPIPNPDPLPPIPPVPDQPHLPINEPCCSSRNTTWIDYRHLHDPFFRPCPPPDHDSVPEGGVAVIMSIIEALEFINNEQATPSGSISSPGSIEIALNATIKDNRVPKTFTEVMRQSNNQLWKGSTDAEIQALLNNGTWELVRLPPGEKAIGSRWVFQIKLHSDGSLDKYKSCLVAKGYTQRPGIDYDEGFTSTAKWVTLRTILAQGAHIESVNISNAYLNGILGNDANIYMEPEGYHQGGKDWVCKLKRGLYGLKQSGRLWYERLRATLESLGFNHLQSDPSIYIWMNEATKIVIPVFVNDLTLVSNSKPDLDQIKGELAKIFKLKDLGATTSLLGVEVDYNCSQKMLKLLQKQYIKNILERFHMEDCHPVFTPMTPGLNLSSAMGPSTL